MQKAIFKHPNQDEYLGQTMTIIIKDIISEDLALRDTAQMFFNKLEQIAENNIIIDFFNIRSISRSFAHEYLTQKAKSRKEISEVNMPPNIQKMFDLVQRPSPKTKLIDVDSVSVMTLQSQKN